MGDFDAPIGSFGGPRSLVQINYSGCVIGKLVDDFELPSVNSQPFCQGSFEMFYSNGATIGTTVDHIYFQGIKSGLFCTE